MQTLYSDKNVQNGYNSVCVCSHLCVLSVFVCDCECMLLSCVLSVCVCLFLSECVIVSLYIFFCVCVCVCVRVSQCQCVPSYAKYSYQRLVEQKCISCFSAHLIDCGLSVCARASETNVSYTQRQGSAGS